MSGSHAREFARIRDGWGRLGVDSFAWADPSKPATPERASHVARALRTGQELAEHCASWVASLGQKFAGARGLDFGCGAGQFSRALLPYYDHVDGIDVGPGTIDIARSWAAQDPRISFRVNQDPDLGSIPSNTYDLVFSTFVLQHNPPWLARRYIREFGRVAKPGGLVLFQAHTGIKIAGVRHLPPALVYRPWNWLQRRRARSYGASVETRWEAYWVRPSDVSAELAASKVATLGQEPAAYEEGRMVSTYFVGVKGAD